VSADKVGAGLQAARVRVCGIVQGVGFRPFIYLLAKEHGLYGWVLNDQEGVEIHLEGESWQVEAFLQALPLKAPVAARLDSITMVESTLCGYEDFQIHESQQGGPITTAMSPDLVVCENCLADLHNSEDSHYEYPYVNCTNCGPRYSIIKSLPYDRPATTMGAWLMCEHCRAGYEDPADRRFHAQPVACPGCGPDYYLVSGKISGGQSAGSEGGDRLWGIVAIKESARLLRDGKIVAIKGIGGYHLAVDAGNQLALETLRTRKYRLDKPFALMVRDLELAHKLVDLSASAQEELTSAARPIVLAEARAWLSDAVEARQSGEARTELSAVQSAVPGAVLSAGLNLSLLAPDNLDLGIMLPYTPLHHLLFKYGAPEILVLTSANISSEPIAYKDEAALLELDDIADFFLVGERPIQRRIDDSVVVTSKLGSHVLRRARGLAPQVVARLPAKQPILALGADLKNTVTLVVAGQAFVSQYIGDLEHRSCFEAFQETIADLTFMYRVKPEDLLVAYDCHPQYLSSQYSEKFPCARLSSVQHHRAHVASVLAEHGLYEKKVLGIAFDGTGWGDDKAIWGGEFFAGSLQTGFERVASLKYANMAGGDAAAKFPPQALAGFLYSAVADGLSAAGSNCGFTHGQLSEILEKEPFAFGKRFQLARQLVEKNLQCWPTSSVGRLFDAAAAIVGFKREIAFEAQAAIWLEHLARRSRSERSYVFPFDEQKKELVWQEALLAMMNDRLKNISPEDIAGAFHKGLALGMVQAALVLCEEHELDTVAFSGGVMQNMLLLDLLRQALGERKLHLLVNHQVPANDGGISLGQAALACFAD
jgi:hydrogenase maturation protein HypF